MKDPLMFLVFLLMLLYCLYLGYGVWFKPKEYMQEIHKSKVFNKKHLPFLPNWLIDFSAFYENAPINIWWGRFVSSMAILICILALIAAVRGPFSR
jgi:hypothetical protein